MLFTLTLSLRSMDRLQAIQSFAKLCKKEILPFGKPTIVWILNPQIAFAFPSAHHEYVSSTKQKNL